MSNNTINTTVHTGTFTKADGTQRTMRFVKLNDVPTGYRGNASGPNFKSPNVETVYDVDARGFRSFNHGTVVGSISTVMESVTFSK